MISLLNTVIQDYNVGNQIFTEEIVADLEALFPHDVLIHLPYWDDFSPRTLDYMRRSKVTFFGGANSLTSDMERVKYMGVSAENVHTVPPFVLVGVGWWKYEETPTEQTKYILQHALHKDMVHSVRDHHTQDMLRQCGIENVMVTGCPSVWAFSAEKCLNIPGSKSDSVLLGLSDAVRERAFDEMLVAALHKNYKHLYFWPQGPKDLAYVQSLSDQFQIIPSHLSALDRFLRNTPSVDYVGTRLHTGIRALQHLKRSIIICVDNRAEEMRKSIHLPVVSVDNEVELTQYIHSEFKTDIRIPVAEIRQWKKQFAALQ